LVLCSRNQSVFVTSEVTNMRLMAWKPLTMLALLAWIFVLVPTQTAAQSWSNGYSYRRAITIDHTKIANTDQTNFPILVSGTYSYLATTANGGNVASASGYDIIFTSDAGGTSNLAFEQESYSPSTGQVNYWVNIPTLSHTADTAIYMFYGNPSIAIDQSNKTAVWDSNEHFVYHLGETSGTTINDSTSNNVTGTKTSAANPSATLNGWIDGAQSFLSSSAGSIGTSDVSTPTDYTIGMWLSPAGTIAAENIFTRTNSSGPTSAWSDQLRINSAGHFQAYTYDGGHCSNLNLGCAATGTTVAAAGSWYYVVVTASNGGIESLYVNGALEATSPALGTLWTGGNQWKLGSNSGDSMGYFNGVIDELEYSSSVRSADWISTQYNNQGTPWRFYTIDSTPSIVSLNPSVASLGASVTITGKNFGATQGTSTVSFNGAAATITGWTTTSIVAQVPQAASTGNVVVNVLGVASNGLGFVLTSPPNISSISPTSGGASIFVTISGTAFGATVGTSTVAFNGTAVSPTSWSPTSIVVPAPLNGTTGPIVVTVGGTASNSFTFTYSSTGTLSGIITRASDGTPVGGAFIQALQTGARKGSSTTIANGSYSISGLPAGVYDLSASANGYLPATQSSNLVSAASTTTVNAVLGAPTINALSPSSGPIGLSVAISGSYFGASQGSSTVAFNGTGATPSGWNNTSIRVPVPTGGTTGPVTVSVSGVTSNPVTFTVGSGTIAGSVTRASDGTAIVGALVEGLQSNLVKASANSGSNGAYTVSNLAPGTYDVRVSASGFGTSIRTGYSVSAGASTTVNASLSLPGTISGKVTKSDGVTAITGASVAIIQGTDTVSSTASDATGNYSISNVPAGTYSVQVGAAGFNTQVQAGAVVSTGNTTTENFALVGQSLITYSYDALGRLTGVVDSQANAAAYSYDAAGNLLSISRNSSTQVSISAFIPQSGPVGTSVTINGTAFGGTPSQNAVKFSGTTTTVTSASVTQLVALVPNGAATGTISVTAPSGSATSVAPFTLKAGNGTPTISGFSPTIGLAGTALTVNGTNFDPNPTNERVKLNASFAPPTSATATTLATKVPTSTSSGHITVATAYGHAMTSNYFFIPPPPNSVASVGFTGSIALGGSSMVQINTAGQIGLLVFDGTAGQRVSVTTTSSTFGFCNVGMSILNPNGSTLTNNGCMGNGGFIDEQTLGSSGTYTLYIQPGSTTGTLTVNLSLVTDTIGTITPGGSAVNLNFTTPGQKARLTWSGTAGQKVSVLTTSSIGLCNVGMSILNPDGSTLTNNGCMGNSAFIDEQTLNQTGTFTLYVYPGAYTGTMTVNLYAITDITGTITPGGSAVNLNFTTPGQKARLTFSGTAGQQVSAHTSSSTFGACNVGMAILNPDGSTLRNNGCMGSNNSVLGSATLGTTGAYTLYVYPGAYTGSLSVTLTSP
jgi:YD repeat-containing protein